MSMRLWLGSVRLVLCGFGGTSVANTLTETVIGVEQREATRSQREWTRWPKRAFLLILCVWAVDLGSPVVIGHTPLRRWLTRRLESGFGRAVEVGSYSLNLWGRPAIEAHEVTVAEDARFGQEYFLRAESLTVRLRLGSLFAGRLEPGTLWLSRPSLNLVRNAEGDWNLAEWLPKPGNAAGTRGSGAGTGAAAARFWRIEVDAGRINFKKSDEKLPYAFTNVSGYVESEGAGRWRIDLGAVPSRAAVIVQQPGMLHLSGDVGGTSSRLRPAKLALSWDGASISDVLRIGRGYDYGVRGNLALTTTAHTEETAWMIEGRMDVAQAHRWDLAARTDNPSASVRAKMRLDFENSSLIVEEATLDTPSSQARGLGNWSWSISPYPKRPVTPMALTVTQASVDLGEVLSWTRAFRAGVADDVTLHGIVALRGHVQGWPLQLVNFVVSSDGATLNGARLRAPVKLGAIQGRYDHGGISLLPVAATFGLAGGTLRADVVSRTGANPAPMLHVAGNIVQVRDLIAAAGALGWSLSRGWDVAGPMRCDVKWQGPDRLWHAAPTGFLELGEAGAGGAASLRAPFINEPLEQIRARAEVRPGMRHVTVTSAEAFGARWTGTLERDDEGWQFAMSADHLASANLDRWLNPRWRQTFFERVLPFLNSSGPASAAPENLRASGRVGIEQFTLAPFVIRGLTGELKIDGRRVELTDATGEVFGGRAEGDFDVTLGAVPKYRVRADFLGVNVGELAGASQTLENLFGGSASGEILVEARGGSRPELANSLTCEGSARVKDAEVRGFDLMASLKDGARRPGKSAFRQASGTFTCGEGRIQLEEVRFTSATGEVSGSGSVDFGRNLDLRLRVTPELATPRATRASYGSGLMYQVTGPMAAPKVTAVAATAQP